jgi:sterol desaturase/sphingolipid hydroxylase (fatty acid hydroxylase superfamily)
MPAALIRSPLGRIFSSTTFHAMHHSRMKGHYSLMTTTIDFLCGTVFPDYDDIYIRAVRGQGTNR